MTTFETKDSGERQVFPSGMHRDTTKGKQRPDLVVGDGPMFDRWVALMTRGAEKYDARNWMKAEGPEELQRFRESAIRHFVQWYLGETDEDHGAAVFFNINGAEYVREKMQRLETKAEEIQAFLRTVGQIPVGEPLRVVYEHHHDGRWVEAGTGPCKLTQADVEMHLSYCGPPHCAPNCARRVIR